jgi:hypothetical protein
MACPTVAAKPDCPTPDAHPSCKNDGGGGKGGMGELGNGCVTFLHGDGEGTFHDDSAYPPYGDETYCNGTDGQVSVPSRFRMDPKKFNKTDRKYYAQVKCIGYISGSGIEFCEKEIETRDVQSQLKYVEGPSGIWMPEGTDIELNFQEMAPPFNDTYEVTRVSMSISVAKQHYLLFGNEFGQRVKCLSDSNFPVVYGAPVWARCDADFNDDTLCDAWTVSTFELDDTSLGWDENVPSAHACLRGGTSGDMFWDDVQADFVFDICVLGISCQ